MRDPLAMRRLFEYLIKSSYEDGFIEFKKENYFYSELDFVKMALKTFNSVERHPCLGEFLLHLPEFDSEPASLSINFAAQYKAFLEQRKRELKIKFQCSEPELIDLSNESAVEKIIYLNELGIIDFLEKHPCFMGSVNNLASALSALTGIKPRTLQTSINRLKIKDTDDQRHPYHTQNTVNKVKIQLKEFGVQLK